MADALKKTSDDAHVISTVAQQFWLESKLPQARKWFLRSTQANPDHGDAYALWYKFELSHGTPELRTQIEQAVEKAKPRHGEVWQPIAKDPQNKKLTTKQVLRLVAEKVVPLK